LDFQSLLQPICEWQKQSEDNHSTISYVFHRWALIHTHLNNLSNSANIFADSIREYIRLDINQPWKQRIKRQLSPIHTLAYFLNPENLKTELLPTYQDEIYQLMKDRLPKDQDTAMIFQEFLQFRDRQGIFNPDYKAWDFKEPKAF
jgi:hypothetical protein